MANQYFDPYYLPWDDGTYGKINISDGEGAATERARRFHAQSLETPMAAPPEPPKSEWRQRADAFLKKTGQESADTSPPRPLVDRPFEDNNSFLRRELPDILQPGKLEKRLRFNQGYFGFEDQKLQAILQEYADAPEWRQAEIDKIYPELKNKVDAQRVELSKQKQNLANARQLEARDVAMEKLAKEDPDFEANWKRVRKIYADFEEKVRPARDIDVEINEVKANLALSGLKDVDNELSGKDVEYNPEVKKLKQRLAELKGKKKQFLAGVEKTTIGSKEFKSAHVNASNTLVDKGLNVKGLKLAGRLLAITPYDEIKSLINAARTGGVVDEEGNFPSPEEIQETKVNEEYDAVVRYLGQTEEDANAAKVEQQNAEKEREINLARAEKEILAAKKERKIRTTIEINNDKLVLKQLDH
jgi:hypothetical protein